MGFLRLRPYDRERWHVTREVSFRLRSTAYWKAAKGSQPKTENSRIVSKPYRFSANISAMAKIRVLRQQCRADLWPKFVRGFCRHDRFVRQLHVVPRSHHSAHNWWTPDSYVR